MNTRRFILLFLTLLAIVALQAASVYSQEEAEFAPPGFDSWEDVLAAAQGTTVNWYLWGGADSINEFVDTFYGPALAEYGVTLNRMPLVNTTDAVEQVIADVAAGNVDNGEIHLIWINGENFFTLKDAGLLYGPWAEAIPNSVLVDWENPAINLDFGTPVDGYESPWSSAQFQFIYDSARMTEDELPRSFAELDAWIRANPGRFTYITPGVFQGTRFVKQVLYEISGGHEQWLGEFNEELYNEWAPQLWDLLYEWQPYLWDEGQTFPVDETQLHALFANGEIDFSLTQATSGAGTPIADGVIPNTSRAFVFHDNMIGDFNYVAIPSNASNIAGALVLANLILRPDLQAAQIIPTNGFGLGYAIDVRRVTDEADLAILEFAQQTFGDAATPAEDLAASLVPDVHPEYQFRIELEWGPNVRER